MRPESEFLLRLIDEAFDRRSWHGTNLRGSVRGITVREAAWRPGKGRHNIWEIVLHTAYWKYAVRRRLVGGKRGSFPLKGSDWFERGDPGDPTLWKSDIQLLERQHDELRDAIVRFTARGPRTAIPSETARLIRGIAAHDLYHAGQIQFIKRMMRTHR